MHSPQSPRIKVTTAAQYTSARLHMHLTATASYILLWFNSWQLQSLSSVGVSMPTSLCHSANLTSPRMSRNQGQQHFWGQKNASSRTGNHTCFNSLELHITAAALLSHMQSTCKTSCVPSTRHHPMATQCGSFNDICTHGVISLTQSSYKLHKVPVSNHPPPQKQPAPAAAARAPHLQLLLCVSHRPRPPPSVHSPPPGV